MKAVRDYYIQKFIRSGFKTRARPVRTFDNKLKKAVARAAAKAVEGPSQNYAMGEERALGGEAVLRNDRWKTIKNNWRDSPVRWQIAR